MKILVTGANGMLGQDLCPILEDVGAFEEVFLEVVDSSFLDSVFSFSEEATLVSTSVLEALPLSVFSSLEAIAVFSSVEAINGSVVSGLEAIAFSDESAESEESPVWMWICGVQAVIENANARVNNKAKIFLDNLFFISVPPFIWIMQKRTDTTIRPLFCV